MKLAVVGAGWAGLAAAVNLTQQGHRVSVFEAAREPGGRARSIGGGLDNGQHILIGAYTQTLRLMRTVGIDTDRALLRMPLNLCDLRGQGIALPDLPPPWNLLVGALRARGWSWSERRALLGMAAAWQRSGFECDPGLSVAQLCASAPGRVLRELIEPLCVSALNTPPGRASAQVFLRVLKDSLKAGAGASDLLLPRVDLGALFPQAAVAWLVRAGAPMHLGSRVTQLQLEAPRSWQIGTAGSMDVFDGVILAVHAPDAVRLLQTLPTPQQRQPALTCWMEAAAALRYEAIATVYAEGGPALPRPMVALAGAACAGGGATRAQFVFDREHLGGAAGLKAFVVSASAGTREEIETAVLAQAREEGLGALKPLRTVVERRATIACTPGLSRPGHRLADGLWACADFVDGPYPSTLEGAVLNAQRVSDAIGPATPSAGVS